MGNYLLDKLAEVKDVKKRRESAEQWFCNLWGSGHVPVGWWHPGSDWPSMEDVEKHLAGEREFYVAFKKVFGGKFPERVQTLYERFEKGAEAMIRITGIPFDDRFYLLPHEFPPECLDFNRAVHRNVERATSNVRFEDLTFTTTVLGKGSFGIVYEAHDTDGNKFALKHYRHPHSLSRYDRAGPKRDGQLGMQEALKENVANNFEELQRKPFASPRFVPDWRSGNWYVMNFARGVCVDAELKSNNTFPKDQRGQLELRFAEFLKSVHDRGYFVGDISWHNSMWDWNKKSVGVLTIIDYDSFGKQEGYANFRGGGIGHPSYLSRERLLPDHLTTVQGEVESLALMIEHLELGTPWIPKVSDWKEREPYREQAEQNKRKYPTDRKQKLPKHLRQVIVPLLTYPRDDSITIDDVIDAVKKEYKV